MRRPIRVGITGAGMTVPWFLEAAEQIPEMEVGALFARKEEKRRELCEKYQIPASYDSYEKLLADDSLDVLYLPLPNSLHYSFAKQALEAGKHLIMEKPFTVTYAEAKELAESVQAALNAAVNGEHEKQAAQVPSSVYLMKSVEAPAVLVECGFLSNPEETALLKEPAHQTRLAAAITAGLIFQIGVRR